MTVHQCIAFVDGIEPNAYTNAQKAAWLSECEGQVYTDVFLLHPNEFTPVTYDADKDRTLALPAPYDRLYPRYLQAMIHYANGEYKRYANSMAEFNEAWGHANRWMGGDYDVADLWRNRRVDATVTSESPVFAEETLLLTVPQGCALVGFRLVVNQAYTKTATRYWVEEPLPEGKYNVLIAGAWYNFETDRDLPTGACIIASEDTPERVSVTGAGGGLLSYMTAAGKAAQGTDLAVPDSSEIRFGGVAVASAALDERGVVPVQMLIADRGGTDLTILSKNAVLTGDGELSFTAKLLIPEEEFFYNGRRPWQS